MKKLSDILTGSEYNKARLGQKGFWNWIDSSAIPDKSFREGFLDLLKAIADNPDDIENLFDKETGALKNKGSYATIKALKDKLAADTDSEEQNKDAKFAIAALAKFWSAQFIDNKITDTVRHKEWEAQRKADMDAENKKLGDEKQAEYDELESNLQEIQKKVDSKLADFFNNQFIPDMKAKSEEANKAAEDLHKAQSELKYATIFDEKASDWPIINTVDWEAHVFIDNKPEKYEDGSYKKYSLRSPGFQANVSLTMGKEKTIVRTNYLSGLDLDFVKRVGVDSTAAEIANDLIEKITKEVQIPYPENEKNYDHLFYKVRKLEKYNEAKALSEKAAQDAEAGRSTAEFEKLIQDKLSDGKGRASKYSDEVAKSRYDDGDSQAAYMIEVGNTVTDLLPYVGYCNWVAKDNQGYEVKCRANSDKRVLEDAFSEYAFGGSDFKVAAADQLDEPEHTIVDSANYSDALVNDYE